MFSFRVQQGNEEQQQAGTGSKEAGTGSKEAAPAAPPPRPGSQMEQGMSSSTSFQNKSKTTSAPTSPLKEKKSSFFGKVRHN